MNRHFKSLRSICTFYKMEVVEAVVTDVGPFEGLDADIMLQLLARIPVEDCLNGKLSLKHTRSGNH